MEDTQSIRAWFHSHFSAESPGRDLISIFSAVRRVPGFVTWAICRERLMWSEPARDNMDHINGLLTAAGHPFVWLGLVRILIDPLGATVFGWVDGTPLSTTNWKSGEPNNAFGEDCVHAYGDLSRWYMFKWNDADCSNEFHFLCQIR